MRKKELKKVFWALLLCNNLVLTQEKPQSASDQSRLYENLEKRYNIKILREDQNA
jgi:hypothetical protein